MTRISFAFLLFCIFFGGCSWQATKLEVGPRAVVNTGKLSIRNFEYFVIPAVGSPVDPVITPTLWFYSAGAYYHHSLPNRKGEPVSMFQKTTQLPLDSPMGPDSYDSWTLTEIDRLLSTTKNLDYLCITESLNRAEHSTPTTQTNSKAEGKSNGQLTLLVFNDLDPVAFFAGGIFSFISTLVSEVTWKIHGPQKQLFFETTTRQIVDNPAQDIPIDQAEIQLKKLYQKHSQLFVEALQKSPSPYLFFKPETQTGSGSKALGSKGTHALTGEQGHSIKPETFPSASSTGTL